MMKKALHPIQLGTTLDSFSHQKNTDDQIRHSVDGLLACMLKLSGPVVHAIHPVVEVSGHWDLGFSFRSLRLEGETRLLSGYLP